MKGMGSKPGGGKKDDVAPKTSPNLGLGKAPAVGDDPPMWTDAECKRVMDGGTKMGEMKKGEGGKGKMGGM